MAKKQYRVEINNVTAEVLAALEGVDYKLYEINEVRKSSESFACTSNFATTELLLKSVETIDNKEYKEQELKSRELRPDMFYIPAVDFPKWFICTK